VRQEYLRATLKRDEEGGLAALPLGNQSSGVAASLSRSEGLLVVPPDTAVALDDLLQFIPYSELGA
jgi:molybdopterin biosynthesis enzyme